MNKNKTLLQHTVVSNPYPPEQGRDVSFTVYVTNNAERNIYCQMISYTFLVGLGNLAIFTNSPDKKSGSPFWGDISLQKAETNEECEEVTSSACNQQEMELIQNEECKEVTVSFNCNQDEKSLIQYPLWFQISGKANQSLWPFDIKITELSREEGEDYGEHSSVYSGVRIQPEFYLRNFYATYKESPNKIVTQVERDKSVRLSWESNGCYYKLSSGEQSEIKEIEECSYLLSDGIKRDTVFLLDASNLPKSDDTSVNDNAITAQHLYSYLVLHVTEPVLTVYDITIKNNLKADSLLGSSGQLLVAGSLEKPVCYTSTSPGFILCSVQVMGSGSAEAVAVCKNVRVHLKTQCQEESIQSGILPVLSGEKFTLGIKIYSGKCKIDFQWISFGKSIVEKRR